MGIDLGSSGSLGDRDVRLNVTSIGMKITTIVPTAVIGGLTSTEAAGNPSRLGTLLAVGAIFGIYGIYETSTGGGGVEIWQDSGGRWHVNDMVPYPAIEKQAKHIMEKADAGADTGRQSVQFPSMILESGRALDAVSLLYGDSPQKFEDNLRVLQCALKRMGSGPTQ